MATSSPALPAAAMIANSQIRIVRRKIVRSFGAECVHGIQHRYGRSFNNGAIARVHAIPRGRNAVRFSGRYVTRAGATSARAAPASTTHSRTQIAAVATGTDAGTTASTAATATVSGPASTTTIAATAAATATRARATSRISAAEGATTASNQGGGIRGPYPRNPPDNLDTLLTESAFVKCRYSTPRAGTGIDLKSEMRPVRHGQVYSIDARRQGQPAPFCICADVHFGREHGFGGRCRRFDPRLWSRCAMPGGRSEVIPAHEIVRYRGDRRALRDGCD
jgi:hypothetical protein